jgi:hypothetical protein
MLIKGNSKLGKQVYHFSLPAHVTCPGETTACASVCYAKNGFYNMNNVKESLRISLKRAKRADFVAKMIAAIGRRKIDVLRIHVSGDFYSAKYIRKWLAIARSCPHVRFYAYTRSWRKARMVKALAALAALPNVHLWWSVDKETHALDGAPPAVARVRVAYMQLADDEPVPAYADLVFRVDYHNAVMRNINGVRVCPVENGVKYAEGKKPTCSHCKLCYRPQSGQTMRPNAQVNEALLPV